MGRGYLDKSDAKAMLGYEHSGGFSFDASIRIAALTPPPRQHGHRYFGIWAPNAPNRSQVTPKDTAPVIKPNAVQEKTPPTEGPQSQAINVAYPARYEGAKLIGRVHQVDLLRCEPYGRQMRMIAFITERNAIKAIVKFARLTFVAWCYMLCQCRQGDLGWKDSVFN